MRKQYFFRSSPDGMLARDVDRLVDLTRSLPVRAIPLSAIRELDTGGRADVSMRMHDA